MAVRGSITDFNNNSIAVQGGTGFADAQGKKNIYNHGITQGASDALDLMTLWVQTVRTLNMPNPGGAGTDTDRKIFNDHCALCHGGAKWTKSQVLYADNPAFTSNPIVTPPGVPRDAGVNAGVTVDGGQIKLYTVGAASITFLEDVGTFKLDDPIFGPLQIRGFGMLGKVGLGAAGFNVPSLLGVAYTPPYFHDGSAATLDEVFARHLLTEGGATNTIATLLPAADQTRLKDFLKTIDGRTVPFRSAGDDFRDLLAAGL